MLRDETKDVMRPNQRKRSTRIRVFRNSELVDPLSPRIRSDQSVKLKNLEAISTRRVKRKDPVRLRPRTLREEPNSSTTASHLRSTKVENSVLPRPG